MEPEMQLKNTQSSRRSVLEGRAGGDRYLSAFLWSLIGIAALMPALLGLIGVLGKHWYPVLDQATMELRVRDVLTHHTSLTGAFGRFDWNHPGPAMYWLVSPFSLAAGGAANASRIGFLFWGIAALALALLLAWRVSRSFYLAISLVIVLSYFSTDPVVFTTPWNPWIPVPLLVLLIVLTYRVAIGRVRELIGVFVVGSLMIQSHAGAAIVVILSIGFCAFFVGADWVRSKQAPDGLVGAAGWSFGALLILWSLPAIGVVTRAPGNLLTLINFFLHSAERTAGLAVALRVTADEFAWRPPWLGAAMRFKPNLFGEIYAQEAPTRWLLIPLVVIVVGGVAAVRSKRRRDFRLVVLAGFLLIATVASIARSDNSFSYTFAWRGVVGPAVVIFALVPLAQRFVERGRIFRITALSAVVLMILVAVPLRLSRMPGERATSAYEQTIKSLVGAINAQEIAHSKRVGVEIPEVTYTTYALARGLVNELDRSGFDVRVRGSNWLGREFGETRLGRFSDDDEVWFLVEGSVLAARYERLKKASVIWRMGTLSIVAVPGRVAAADLLRHPMPPSGFPL